VRVEFYQQSSQFRRLHQTKHHHCSDPFDRRQFQRGCVGVRRRGLAGSFGGYFFEKRGHSRIQQNVSGKANVSILFLSGTTLFFVVCQGLLFVVARDYLQT
jgi:hypothetical protein